MAMSTLAPMGTRTANRLARRLADDAVRSANRRTGGKPVLFSDPLERDRLDAICESVAAVLAPLLTKQSEADDIMPTARHVNARPSVRMPN